MVRSVYLPCVYSQGIQSQLNVTVLMTFYVWEIVKVGRLMQNKLSSRAIFSSPTNGYNLIYSNKNREIELKYKSQSNKNDQKCKKYRLIRA